MLKPRLPAVSNLKNAHYFKQVRRSRRWPPSRYWALLSVDGEGHSPQTGAVMRLSSPLMAFSPERLNPFEHILKRFYREQLAYLEHADLLMAISESSRNEGITHLGKSPDLTENTAVGVDDFFKPLNIPKAGKQAILNRFGLTRRFLMYSGATDERKNHLRLIMAFSLLPASLRKKYQLAIVGRLPDEHRENFKPMRSYADWIHLWRA